MNKILNKIETYLYNDQQVTAILKGSLGCLECKKHKSVCDEPLILYNKYKMLLEVFANIIVILRGK
jgi:hypothetical protein